MSLVQMIVQNDAAHAIVNKLGQIGIVEFRDVNKRPPPPAHEHNHPCHPIPHARSSHAVVSNRAQP